ncbi:hypothetical protein MMC13_000377 [Lambiella insularis]|nr:hypothetical protein [Lambiella insularis]
MSPSRVLPSLDFTTFHNIVDGKPRGGEATYHGINGATETPLWEVPVASQQDVEDAVASATAAFPSWSHLPYSDRVKAVRAWGDEFAALHNEFTELLITECAKPKEMIAKYEVDLASKNVNAYSDLTLPEETLKMEDRTVHTRSVPVGIVACIWPVIVSINKMAPALLTGNCAIVKPSPFSPYTALKMVELGQQFFPPGVLQVLSGDEKLGPLLVEHPKIHKVSFTGSIPTGKAVMAAAAKTLKRVTLELGGNDAMIICPDVDIKTVAPQVVWGAFRNSGQACVCSKRIYIHEDIYDEFVATMVQTTANLKIGPLQNKMQFEKVKGFFEDSKAQGHEVLIGGDIPTGKKGYFASPTIIRNPPNDSRIIMEEPFGPIIPVQPWKSEQEIIARANDTNTGLGACIYSADVERAMRIGRDMECGSVWINSYEKPTAKACMSGHKESGIGGEGGESDMADFQAHQLCMAVVCVEQFDAQYLKKKKKRKGSSEA